MVVNEYGSPTDPAVILLAPMMVSGSDLYELMSPHFSGTYYFIAPDQGGHGKAGSYKNADDEYRQLKAWLLDNGIQKPKKGIGKNPCGSITEPGENVWV